MMLLESPEGTRKTRSDAPERGGHLVRFTWLDAVPLRKRRTADDSLADDRPRSITLGRSLVGALLPEELSPLLCNVVESGLRVLLSREGLIDLVPEDRQQLGLAPVVDHRDPGVLHGL